MFNEQRNKIGCEFSGEATGSNLIEFHVNHNKNWRENGGETSLEID